MTKLKANQAVQSLPVSDVLIDETIQPRRDGLDEDHVRALVETGPDTWPPVVVVDRDGQYVLIDGWHRLEAARQLELESIACDNWPQPEGGDLHAFAFSLNKEHGKPLTLADRKAEATRLLHIVPDISSNALARRCGLSDKTVGSLRTELEATSEFPKSSTRLEADGKRRPSNQPRAETATAPAQKGGRTASDRAPASTTAPSVSQPSLIELGNLVDAVCDFINDYADDELGPFIAEALAQRWPGADRQDKVAAMRTLGEHLLTAAARLEQGASETESRTVQEQVA